VVSAAMLVPPHYLLFARYGALWTQSLDADRLRLTGDPVLVAPRVLGHPTNTGSIAASSSRSGRIAYRTDGGARQLVWLDRSGRQIATLGEADLAQPGDIRLSVDGETLALRRTVDGNTDVWLISTARGLPRRLTFDPGVEYDPVLSPDGRRVAFASDQDDQNDLYEMATEGQGNKTVLIATPEQENLYDWSSDGRFLLYGNQGPNDLWVLPVAGTRKPFAFVRTPFNELNARFSPDGRWVAYQSDETGGFEVYVQPFPEPGDKLRISPAGGSNPEWRRNGQELFYLSADNRLMVLQISDKGARLVAGAPSVLFPMPAVSRRFPYAVSPDGQRVLVNKIVSDSAPITILFNWRPPTPER
jgi:eukaryotic-like serine/threonine-protein kinase